MVGVGLSVFEGTRIDSFTVLILGVLKNQQPGTTLVLARAQGDYLERTGIIAGMSGSPVYINGRLLGAIAYTWSFSKDPVAGITPIGEMLDLLPPPGTVPSEDTEERVGSLDDGSPGPWTEPSSSDGAAPALAAAAPALAADGASPALAAEAANAHPIATPIVFSGFGADAMRFLAPWLEERGFVAGPGGGSVPGISCDKLVPGSAVGVELVRGDWSAAAIGTLTYRDGDKILAFGHPFSAMGWVRFPLTAATIHTVFASQQISSKVGSPTTPCGTLLADRSVGVAGEVGASPSMIPVAVSIQGTGKRNKSYHFEVVRSRLLTPNLVASAVVNSISEALNDAGFATIRYDVTFAMNGGKVRVRKGNALLTQSPVQGVGEEISQSLTVLLSDHLKPSVLDSVQVHVQSEVGLEASRITEVRVRPSTAAPGDSVQVEITMRHGGSATEIRRVGMRIPPQTQEGELTIRVCDGEESDRWEQNRAPDRFKAKTFDDVVRLLETERRLDRIYVQMYRVADGATARGGEISQAPPSFLGALDGANGGATGETKGATLQEISVDAGVVVRGCETAKINVVPDRMR